MSNLNFSQEQIQELIVKCLTYEATDEERVRLYHWIKENKENKAYFKEIQAGWSISEKSRILSQFDSDAAWKKFSERTSQKRIDLRQSFGRKIQLPIWNIAASWLIFLIIGSLTIFFIPGRKNNSKLHATEIIAPLGSRTHVVLPDGSSLWLNAGSKISYGADYGTNKRKVVLTGEAFFDVVSNREKPFEVFTADLVVRALGTRFNVKAYPDENTVTATLEQGKIDVRLIGRKEKSIELQPNENIIYHKTTAKIEKNATVTEQNMRLPNKSNLVQVEIQKNVKTALFTSWKEDKWIIESEPLASLVPKLERRYNMRIIFQDDELKKYKFSGTIRNETAEQILMALRLTAPLDYVIQQDTVRLFVNSVLKEKYLKIITNQTK